MCLSIPGKILSITGSKANVDFDGIKRVADISLLDNCKVGEYVLVHVGFAIQKIDEDIAKEAYRLLDKSDLDELNN